MITSLRNLVMMTVLLVVTLNFTSAYLRHAKSGLACDEPAVCYQQVAVTGEMVNFTESDGLYHFATMAHRVIALLIAVSVLLLTVRLFRAEREEGVESLKPYAVVMGGAVLWLAGLGAAVGASLQGWVIAGNLLGGLLLLVASSLLLARLLGWELQFSLSKVVLMGGGMLLLALFFQGSIVSTTFSGMICSSLPDCDGVWWSDYPLTQIQMMHRFSAVVTLLYFVGMVLRGLQQGYRHQRWVLLVLLSMLLLQMALGAIMVEQQLPLLITTLHSTLSQLLIAVLVTYLALAENRGTAILGERNHG